MTTLVSIITILGLLMGGGAGTVYAAQDSSPNEALYGLKIASENVRLNMTGDAEKQLNLLLDFANRRGDEIKALALEGETPPEATLKMLNTQLQQATQLAGKLDSEAKLKVENAIRNQMQLMLKLQENVSEEGAMLMEQARIAMENQLKTQYEGAGEAQGQSQNKNQGENQGQGQNQDQGQGEDQGQGQGQGQRQNQGQGQDQDQGGQGKGQGQG